MAKFKYPELPEFPEIPEPPFIPEVPQIPMPEIPPMPESVIEAAELAQASFVNSGLIETLQQINGEFLAGAVNIIQAVSDAVQNYWSSTLSELADTAGRLIEAVANFKLPTLTDEEAEQLVESNRTWGQYGWTYIPSMPISMYDTPPADIKEANKVAIQYCTAAEMEKVFDELGKWKLNHRDLESAIFCYKNKQYKACALLLCGMIESKLIRQQSDAKRPVGAGAVARLKENYDGSGEKILAEAMFTYNLLSYLETLFAKGKGFKAEPDTLNRNYIGHGMNHRAVRKRDCIQLFLALNNLMHFFDLGL